MDILKNNCGGGIFVGNYWIKGGFVGDYWIKGGFASTKSPQILCPAILQQHPKGVQMHNPF